MSFSRQQDVSDVLQFCSSVELSQYLDSLQRNPTILRQLNKSLTVVFRFYLGFTSSPQSIYLFRKNCEEFCALIPILLEHPGIHIQSLIFDGYVPQQLDTRTSIIQALEKKSEAASLTLNFQRCVLDSSEALTDWLHVLRMKLKNLVMFQVTRGPMFDAIRTSRVSSLTELQFMVVDNTEWQLCFALIDYAPYLRTLRLSANYAQDEGIIRKSNLFDDLKLFNSKYLNLLQLEVRLDPGHLHWVVPVIHSACVATGSGALAPHPALKQLGINWYEPSGRDEEKYFPEPEWASILYHLSPLFPGDGTGVGQLIITRVPGPGALPPNRAEPIIRRRFGAAVPQAVIRVQDGTRVGL